MVLISIIPIAVKPSNTLERCVRVRWQGKSDEEDGRCLRRNKRAEEREAIIPIAVKPSNNLERCFRVKWQCKSDEEDGMWLTRKKRNNRGRSQEEDRRVKVR